MLDELTNFLKREGDFSFWKNVIFMAVLSGIANAGLLALINIGANLAQNEDLNYRFLAIYVVVFLIFFIAKKYSILQSTQEIEKIIKNIRERISNKVRKSELITIENIEQSTIFTSLTRDTNIISQSAISLMNTAQSLIMIFFALIYILIISKMIFFIIVSSITLTIMIYMAFLKEVEKELVETNRVEDNFFTSLNTSLHGFKELKINHNKNEDFANEHRDILNNLFNLKVKLNNKFITNMMFTETFLYILLGTIVFIVPHIATEESSTIIQVTAAMLFIIGPLDSAVSAFPMASRSATSIKGITDLENFLDKNTPDEFLPDAPMEKRFNNFKKITLKDIDFYYLNHKNEKVFGIESINLDIKKGETIFIIGGNGSGKSTLIKTLLGLYSPSSGAIYMDSEVIDKYNYEAYKNLFSIILTDFHLFRKLYGIEEIDYELINSLLIEMKLNHKSKFIDGKFTDIKLSTGQRKRLALVSAIIEDKPIYVFDEWAADQDPQFRKYFYTKILKRLKEQGKTIIAVTHDDAYFHVADRVYQMDYGNIIEYRGLN